MDHVLSSANSRNPSESHWWMFYVELVVECTLLVVGLVGNGLLVHMYGVHHGLRTAPNSYVLSIAVSDLLVTASCPLAMAVTAVAGGWPLPTTVCRLSQAVMEFSNCATVLALVALSIERYHAVVHPVDNFILGQRFTLSIIIAIWIVSVIFSVPKFIKSNVVNKAVLGSERQLTVSACVFEGVNDELVQKLVLFGFFLFYAVPLCVVGILYTLMYRHLIHHAPTLKRRSLHQAQIHSKVSRMAVALNVIFFVSFLPYNVLRLKISLGNADSYWSTAAAYAYCFGCLHFWLNPIALYVFCDSLRKHYNSYFSCWLFWRKGQDSIVPSHKSAQHESILTTVSTLDSVK